MAKCDSLKVLFALTASVWTGCTANSTAAMAQVLCDVNNLHVLWHNNTSWENTVAEIVLYRLSDSKKKRVMQVKNCYA